MRSFDRFMIDINRDLVALFNFIGIIVVPDYLYSIKIKYLNLKINLKIQ